MQYFFHPDFGPWPLARRFMCFILALALLLLTTPAAHAQLGAGAAHMTATLVAESSVPAPGAPVTLALAMRPDHGWHGYWQNPGKAGYAPQLKWTLPRGAQVSAPQFPLPDRLVVAGLTNYVLTGPQALLVTLDLPSDLARGTALPIAVEANWLACSADSCVPQSANLVLTLVAGDGAVTPDKRQRFDGWRAALPRPFGATAHFEIDHGVLRFRLPYPARAALHQPWLFAADANTIDPQSPQAFTRDGDQLLITARLSDTATPFKSLDAVLRIAPHQGLKFSAQQGVVAVSRPDNLAWTIALALGGAVLGGLILNVMPCVFPVIGLKALSLARAGGDEHAARRDALAYTAGVISVCLALGGLMLGLRAAGHSVGWAFQLQDPRVIVLMLLLLAAITANLAGLFELGSFGGGDSLTRKHGFAGSFWTGALAAFVATPCTGPFMAAALGTALILPTAAALATFAGLGLGLAFPFLALGFVPALRTRLPRPGPWMQRLRALMAVPMGVTALALGWLLSRQAGLAGLAVGIVAVAAMLFGLWLIGRRQRHDGELAHLGLLPIGAAIVGSLIIITPSIAAIRAGAGMPNAEAFSETRLAALQNAHQPVFVYFTADWCLTCKVNEQTTLETRPVEQAFARHGVTILVGDWTNGDAAIGRFLAGQKRSGVPLYLFYPAGSTAPTELPQVLTIGTVTDLFAS